jgi:hypothetical protein
MKCLDFALQSISFILRRVLLQAAKCNDMGPTALLSLRRKSCCGSLSPLKIYRPRQNLNRKHWVQ